MPHGYERVENHQNSFGSFLRTLPLKKNKRIQLWDGSELDENHYSSLGVIDLPLLFDEDLEQCADFAMRIWADYLKNNSQLRALALFDYNGRKKPFVDSGKSYLNYLKWHMRHSNSYSIKMGGKRVRSEYLLESGDMFVQNTENGEIGHVSMVIDQAENKLGQKLYLVGYSFMPAQQFHIERAPPEFGISGWFTAKGYINYAGKHAFSSFGEPVLVRFEPIY